MTDSMTGEAFSLVTFKLGSGRKIEVTQVKGEMFERYAGELRPNH